MARDAKFRRPGQRVINFHPLLVHDLSLITTLLGVGEMTRVILLLLLLVVEGACFAPRIHNAQRLNVQHACVSVPRCPQVGRLEMSTTSVDAVVTGTGTDTKGMAHTLKVGGLFGLWYALNIGYNIYNKRVLNLAPALTYTTGFLQLFMGLIYVIPLWTLNLRKKPEVTNEELKTLLPLALCHLGTHLGAIVSLGAGAVSFTHIVKAAEPAVSAAMSAVLLKSYLPLPVYLSLLPVMGGVALASLSELSFTWLSFLSAMVSNFSSAARGIVGKMQMGKSMGRNMDATNLYAVMTILSAIMCLPISLAIEGSKIVPTMRAMQAAGTFNSFWIQSFITALLYYSYNEVAFLTLDNVAPVTHALGNTIKRVVIIITSVLVFGTKMTPQGVLGSSVAIAGVLLYSIAKNNFK